jgi:hypothetical protein
MIRDISTTSTIEIPCRQEDALAAVWDIKNIERTEVKADSVTVFKETDRKGTYEVHGRFAGVAWKNNFTYELNDRGFHSVETNAPATGPRIQGGFIVEPLGENRCRVIHYEQYRLPRKFVPLKPLIVAYLKWSMRKELRDLQDLIFESTGTVPSRV